MTPYLEAYDRWARLQMGNPGGPEGSGIVAILEVCASQFAGWPRMPPDMIPPVIEKTPPLPPPSTVATPVHPPTQAPPPVHPPMGHPPTPAPPVRR